MIPVSVLTGFLGSGKTTLLGRLLRSPQFSRTAVIINEFGEVGLDHDLIETSEESFVELQTGCVCCTVRGDLVRTLEGILRRRDQGAVAPFDRVVIETGRPCGVIAHQLHHVEHAERAVEIETEGVAAGHQPGSEL